MLMPDDVDDKIGDLVSNVILSKHPNVRDIEINSIPHCNSCLDLININASKENVEKVAKCMSGSTGPIGLDSVSFSHCLLEFSRDSTLLRRTTSYMVE